MHLVAALSRASTKWAQLQCINVPRGTDRRPACLPRLEWSLQGAHVEPTSSPRRAHAESASSPRPSHRQAAQCRLVLSTTTATTAAGRLGGWNACQGHRHGIGNLACGDANSPADTHQIGPGSEKIRQFMFSGPRASLLAGIELTSSDVRRVWLPLLRGFRTSASGRTTDGWLDVWCLYAPGDLYRHACGGRGAEKTRIVVRVDAVKRDGIVRRSGHLVHTRLVLSLVQFKVLTHIGIMEETASV
ncbi:hypothetical protein MANI_006853 [Metarhizium anisopliae]|nr:hypothetical protein MANI_006853 [Metarhizium anisopliae]